MPLAASIEEPSVEENEYEWLKGFTCEWTNDGVGNHGDGDLSTNVKVPGCVEIPILTNKEWHTCFLLRVASSKIYKQKQASNV